jgi:hypothetical protein
MMIIGVDYHPSFQTIAFLMEETGECGEQELNHSDGQAEKFYRDLKQRGICVRVGMEATGALIITWPRFDAQEASILEAAAGFVLPRTKPVRAHPKKWPKFLNSGIVTAQQSVSRYRSHRFWSPLSNSWHRVRARRHQNAASENNVTPRVSI